MERPAISVVICVKDRSAYLTEALLSVQNQTFSDWECIVVDDHSTENIRDVVESLQDERFKYVANQGKPGISASRNMGNRLARAEWIAVADSDDINLPRRLARAHQTIQENPDTDVVYASMYAFFDGTYQFRAPKTWQPYDRELLYSRVIIPHGTAVYRKRLVQDVRYNEALDSAVDYDLWLSLADRHARFLFIDEPLVLYRRHAEQISTDPERLARQTANAAAVRANHPYQV